MIVTIRAIGTEEDPDLEVLGEIEIEVDPEIGEVDLEIEDVDNFHCPFLNKLHFIWISETLCYVINLVFGIFKLLRGNDVITWRIDWCFGYVFIVSW